MGGALPKSYKKAGKNADERAIWDADFTVKDIYGAEFDLTRLRGKVVQFTNVACK